jgi:prepilin-type processing-associated H-X9-DG protein
LVVVAIIAVLMAILLPAVKSARERARSAKCLVNTRNLGQAFYQYTISHDGWMPGIPISFRFDPLKCPDMYWCPSATTAARWNGDPEYFHANGQFYFSYAVNSFGWDPPLMGLGTSGRYQKKISAVKNASEMVCFVDSDCNCMIDCVVYPLLDPEWAGPGYRHMMGANVVFVDGHEKWYHIRDLVGRSFSDPLTGRVVVRPGEENGKRRMWNIDNKD